VDHRRNDSLCWLGHYVFDRSFCPLILLLRLRRLEARPTQSKPLEMSASLNRPRLCLFGLPPSREALLLRPIVRTRFQLIVPTLVAVEENDLLLGFAFFRHGVSTSGIALAARAFWTGDAEAPASSDASAPSYGAPKDVSVLAIVETELKFIQIQRQVLLRDMMVRPDYPALQQAPERIQVLGMHFAAHVLASGVLDGIVRESEHVQVVITLPFVRRDQINFLAYGLTHKAIEGRSIGVLDHLTDHVALAGDRADDRRLVATQSALTLFLSQWRFLSLPPI
jgi:hypothetical protein